MNGLPSVDRASTGPHAISLVPALVGALLVAGSLGLVPGIDVVQALAAQAGRATLVGPLQSSAENATTDWGREAGFSVPLPNGKDFWVFGDTPATSCRTESGPEFQKIGSREAQPASLITSLGSRRHDRSTNWYLGKAQVGEQKPTHLLPNPTLYLPDGSRRRCTKAVAGPYVDRSRRPRARL